MPIKTKRWNDQPSRDDGYRILICRYRPRGVPKANEAWDDWWPDLGPSRLLHANFYGKNGPRLGWEEYRRQYLEEMKGREGRIAHLTARVTVGETVTLLCSSACNDPSRCHRTLLRALIEAKIGK